uniref:Uncharacterized protein n=1 Tax=Lepeophtheirus salmonis TaxID=72036 RepID=A0A0K2TXY4_LEPSM
MYSRHVNVRPCKFCYERVMPRDQKGNYECKTCNKVSHFKCLIHSRDKSCCKDNDSRRSLEWQ